MYYIVTLDDDVARYLPLTMMLLDTYPDMLSLDANPDMMSLDTNPDMMSLNTYPDRSPLGGRR